MMDARVKPAHDLIFEPLDFEPLDFEQSVRRECMLYVNVASAQAGTKRST
jgi:hypothetical protein